MKRLCLSLFALLLAAGCGGAHDSSQTLTPASIAGLASMREACSFTAGARVEETLGLGAGERAAMPIKHVIVLMKENRSFDQLFGQLSLEGQPDAEPTPPTFSNPDPSGKAVVRYHESTTCDQADPPHQWVDVHAQYDHGKMDGFVRSAVKSQPATDGHFVMGYYDASDLPFYYWLANTYALADHYFPSVLSGTWANRDYLVAATSDGIKNTLQDPPLSGAKLIFDELDAAGVSWQVYTDDLAPLEFSVSWTDRKRWGTVGDFLAALQTQKLPSVVFLDATTALVPPESDEHPPGDLQAGEAWTRSIYDAVVHSPEWSQTALFFTYDEAGGFADHLPPPQSCAPSADQAEFTELGVRVPLIVVSPYAKRHFVSHSLHQHTSILRFIETVFDLPALTARDANSDALLDLFDFSRPNPTPLPDAPAAGSGRCLAGSHLRP